MKSGWGTDPALAEQLHLRPPPSFGVILPLELARGLLFALALLPLIAVARLGRRRLAVWLGWILFVAGALVSLLVNQAWPVLLRVYHGVEIFFQNFTLGLVIGYQARLPKSRRLRKSRRRSCC